MYQTGGKYIWQNQRGEYISLNGVICTVIGRMKIRRHPLGFSIKTWETDTPWCYKGEMTNMVAFRGDLVPVEEIKISAIIRENAVFV